MTEATERVGDKTGWNPGLLKTHQEKLIIGCAKNGIQMCSHIANGVNSPISQKIWFSIDTTNNGLFKKFFFF